MRDPQQAIRNAYLALLKDAVYTAGPVYAQVYADFVPSTAQRPYVLLSQQTVSDARTGNCPSASCTILVEIVQEYQGGLSKTSEVNDMASLAITALTALGKRPTNELEGFEVTTHYLESSNVLMEERDASVVIRRLMRFRDIVFETVTT